MGHAKDQGIETSTSRKRTETKQVKNMHPHHGKVGHKAHAKRSLGKESGKKR